MIDHLFLISTVAACIPTTPPDDMITITPLTTETVPTTTTTRNLTTDVCLQCICVQESQCKPIGCEIDVGTLSCGYYQIKLEYYQDCGMPGIQPGEDVTVAWMRCSDDFNCALTCVQNYMTRYMPGCAGTGESQCEIMARLHNGGPMGCFEDTTLVYWGHIMDCCGCT